ncbi:MAG: flotillin [Lachnospiraceae bacterium]|nr:flotillin [Lachnospiraceae bacterium]
MNTNIGISFPVVPVVIIIAAVIVVLFVLSCYRKAPPTEAIVVTGFGHKVPKVVSGKGVFVIPLLQRADSLNMRVIKLDVKTPATGVKTAEGVPVWIDSVVTTQVYSKTSTLTEKEKEEMGELTAEEYILQRQQAAISNFLGCGENEIDAKVNDILQGNLREIIAEMTVEEALTKRKEFASRVIDNARPDLAKMGLEGVPFNIPEIKDAEDSCGKSHGVIEAIGVEKEMEVKRKAETARANAKRDIEKSQAEAAQEANDARVNSDKAIAEKQNELAIRRAELKKDADKAAVEAEAVSQIQGQI